MEREKEYQMFLHKLIEETRGRAHESILTDIGWFILPEKTIGELFSTNERFISTKTKFEIVRDIFLTDPDIIEHMIARDNLMKTLTVNKIEFSYIIAANLKIGKNKAFNILNDLINLGYFTVIASNTRAYCIQPSDLTNDEKKVMSNRIDAQINMYLNSDFDQEEPTEDERYDNIMNQLNNECE